jgi:hypothetical protein
MAEKSGGSGRITAGELFGQKRPPLYETIKNILRDYPSGQIFKVLYICTCTNLWKSVSRWVYTEKHTATTQNQPGWYELCIISVYTVCRYVCSGRGLKRGHLGSYWVWYLNWEKYNIGCHNNTIIPKSTFYPKWLLFSVYSLWSILLSGWCENIIIIVVIKCIFVILKWQCFID